MLEHFARRGYQTAWVGKNHTFSDEALAELSYVEIRRTLERQLSAWRPW